jgi:hypothetical protein
LFVKVSFCLMIQQGQVLDMAEATTPLFPASGQAAVCFLAKYQEFSRCLGQTGL